MSIDRVLLTLGVLGVAVACWLLMLRGWRRRAGRQADLPPLPVTPAEGGAPLVAPLSGLYLGTTTGEDWLDRIAARGLGRRVATDLVVTADGVSIEEVVFIPAAAVRGARLDDAHAGRVLGPGALVVVEWAHGDRRLDSGFRGDARSRHAEVVHAIEGLVGTGSPAPPVAGDPRTGRPPLAGPPVRRSPVGDPSERDGGGAR